MYSTIYKILESNRVDGLFFTHVSLINPKGKFQIPRQNLEYFWDEYCKLVQQENNPNIGIAEKPQHYIPILVDVDIKIKDNEDIEFGEKIYTDNHISQVVSIYQSVLRKILNNCQEENLYCFVLEKPLYRVNNYIKNGFHLHFPYTFLSKTDQEVHLLPRVKALVGQGKIFENLGFQNSAELIDESYCRVNWLLYGSKKDENMHPYRLSKIINGEGDEISLSDALQEYFLYDVDEVPINYKDKEEFYLPRILSIIPLGRKTCELKNNLTSPLKEISKKKNKEKEVERKKYQSESVQEELKQAREILNFISPARADNYNDWMDIGWTIYNISDGNEEGLNLWIDFSSRSEEKFDEGRCVNEWEKMIKKNKTLGSLKYFAELDSPEEYRKFRKDQQIKRIELNLANFSHNDIAKYLYEEYGNQFTCASISYNRWFQFRDNHWREIDDGTELRKKISEDSPGNLIYELKRIQEDYNKKSLEMPDEFQKAKYQGLAKTCYKLIQNLGNATFKNNVLKECKEVFYSEHFLKFLDRNHFLIGFKNGVYDLKNFVFRECVPEDYISLQMPIEYKVFDQSDKAVVDVLDFLQKIFPDKSVRDYFLDVTSDVFVGGNQAKKVWFWSGEGDNGKSVTQSIFEKMLGAYAVKLPTSLIVGKRTASSAASPELVRAGNGVRWAVLQEPDKKDVINVGLLKELSGNDSFFARGLFKEGGEIEPMFKLVVICNDPPSMPYNDKAAWNRIRVIPFESTFCDNPPVSWEEQLREKRFPKDPFFAEKIPDMIQAFAWLLLEHRKKGIRRIEPDKVTLATNTYKIKNDIYRQFIEECTMEDKNYSLSLSEIYTYFKEWFKDSMPNHSTPVKNEVKEYLIKLWGDPDKGCKWKGFRLFNYEEEVGDGFVLEEKDLENYSPGHLL